MKRRALGFVFALILIISIVPIINVMSGLQKGASEGKASLLSRLYNFDFAIPLIQFPLSRLSVSLSPEKVVIGKNGWFYLGDFYQETITRHRYGASPEQITQAGQVLSAMKSWNSWFKSEGVACFRVMICPDKSTIYPEFMPDWARKVTSNPEPIDLIVGQSPGGLISTAKDDLVSAKSARHEVVYYKTDTHWNRPGAWIGYKAFFSDMRRDGCGGDLRFLDDSQVSFSSSKRGGGDLPRMLGLDKTLQDDELTLNLSTTVPVETEQIDYDTGRSLRSGGNPEVKYIQMQRLVLVRSRGALNQKRVLWFRDSFGTPLSSLMTATFSETLQVDHSILENHAEVARIVKSFHPDYVFVTIVERNILLSIFTEPAPAVNN
jgi:hypothetical protein